MTPKQRRTEAIRHLKNLRTKYFCQSDWGTPVGQTGRVKCGTPACAAGHLTLNKKLYTEGLRINYGGPSYRDLLDYEALAAFFGISEDDALLAFGTMFYSNINTVTPYEVALRLECPEAFRNVTPC